MSEFGRDEKYWSERLNGAKDDIESLLCLTKLEVFELKAQVEQFLEIINHYQEGQVPSDNAMDELIHRANKTPAQYLAEIKAQAGRDGFIAGINARRSIEYDVHNGDWGAADRAADEYANQLRQKAKVSK